MRSAWKSAVYDAQPVKTNSGLLDMRQVALLAFR